jgi:hypothetical protein
MTSKDKPTIWADMTPEQKGALLLAEHEGVVIQRSSGDLWVEINPNWNPSCAYRVEPEPKRETMTLNGRMYISKAYPDGVFDADHRPRCAGDTHRITFDTIDGEPDCATVRMERLT